MSEVLKNLKVVELASVLAGPSVGMFFAEQGSRVIKVEHPIHTDVTRTWKLKSENRNSSVSAYFSSINYCKEYVKIDLKSSEGKAHLSELLLDADILLTNFKKGDDLKFGLDYTTLKSLFPQLILGEINGFGEDSERVAYDLILQAESGFMSMNGQPNSAPTKMPVALIDILAAHQLKEGILVALLNRTLSGKGCKVSVSLYDSAIASLVNQASNYLMEGHLPTPIGSIHPNIAPYGELFESKDGKALTFAIGSDKQFRNLCTILGKKALSEEPLFLNNQARIINRTPLQTVLQKLVNQLESDDILAQCHELFVPAAQIKNLKEVFSSKEAEALVLEENIEGIETKRVQSVVFKITE